jgi:hypothetical protein
MPSGDLHNNLTSRLARIRDAHPEKEDHAERVASEGSQKEITSSLRDISREFVTGYGHYFSNYAGRNGKMSGGK